jgi:hypothetical protein
LCVMSGKRNKKGRAKRWMEAAAVTVIMLLLPLPPMIACGHLLAPRQPQTMRWSS